MKQILRSSELCLKVLAVFAVATLVVPTGAFALSLGLSSPSPTVGVGDSVEVELFIEGLSDFGAGFPPSLSVFDLDIGFESSILGFTGAVFGDPILGDQLDLFGFGSDMVVTPGVTSVNVFQLSYDLPWDLIDFQADSFVLATLSFDANAEGTSLLDITVNALGDEWGDPLVPDSLVSATVTVASIPDASTIVLLMSAGAIGAIGRMRRKAS